MLRVFKIKNIIDSIKKVINNVIDQLDENIGPKLNPVKIKSNHGYKGG